MNSFDRFAQLWTDYLEGDISDAAMIELRELITSNPEHLKAATELFQLHRMLGLISQADSEAFVQATMGQIPVASDEFVKQILSRIEAQKTSSRTVQPVDRVRSHSRQLRTAVVATAALALVMLILVSFAFRNTRSAASTASRQVTFANTARGKFLGAFTPAIGSAAKMNNEYILTSGSVQLKFPTGAEAIVEGPAIFNVLSDQRLQISVGQCSVYCPDGAEGFAVDTPSAHVVDRGTRFAVKVVESSSTEVHVIEGVADVFRPSTSDLHAAAPNHSGTSTDKVRLTNNQARTFDHDSDFVPVPTDFRSQLYQSQLPDRILSYQATEEDGGVKDLTSVHVQRGGAVRVYAADQLVAAKLVWFKIAEKIDDMRHLAGPSHLPVNRQDLLSDFGLYTGAINPGGSLTPLMSDPVFPGPGVNNEDTTPGFAVQFARPIVNRSGPDILFFELQNVTGSPDGDAFRVSPLNFAKKRKTITIDSYDLTLTSPEVQRPTTFYLHDFDNAVDSFAELLNGQCRPLPKPQGWASYRVIAVAIDLSSMGFEDNEPVDGLFFQDCLDDPNHVDPVAIFGLP